MKKLIFILWSVTACVAHAVTFTWNASTSPDVAGYKIHWGVIQGAPDNHQDVGNVLIATIDNAILPKSTIDYFTTTAYDSAGVESLPSNEVAFLLEPVAVSPPPGTPAGSRMDIVNGGIHLLPGTTVLISADIPPAGMLFDQWTGDISILSNFLSDKTTAVMPSIDVEVTATYKNPVLPVTDKIRFYPPLVYNGTHRMAWGWFSGAQTIDGPYTAIYTIQPYPIWDWNEVSFPSGTLSQYKFLRYNSPKWSYGAVGEIEFWINGVKATGIPFGSGTTFGNAFDGDPKTIVNEPTPDGNYCGIGL